MDKDFVPLPSLSDADFQHPKMLDFGLPLCYRDINWRDQSQRDGYILFVMWFVEELLRQGFSAYNHEEIPAVVALHAQLDQIHAEMRENALHVGLSLPSSPAPFAELEGD